jgi:hypothetical protein
MTMLTKITLALALAIAAISTIQVSVGSSFAQSNRTLDCTPSSIACALGPCAGAATRLLGANGYRDSEPAYQTAQFCVPQYDIPGAQAIYC